MRHPAERDQLLTIIADLLRFQLLDPAGGAVSIRLSTGDILMSTTGSAFHRWNITPNDFILLAPDGAIVEQTGGLGASGTPIHLATYQTFPACNAIIHAHAPYSLAFASAGLDLPSCTNEADTLGHIPCLIADDATIKANQRANPTVINLPEGMVQRPDVAAVNLRHLIPQLRQRLAPRAAELTRHGLAFLIYRHGAFAIARHLDEAFDNLHRVEATARTAIYRAALANRESAIPAIGG
jgi:ribulose-5-phosphate 4-epimerase/fuculose-1-phosphate aldolase